MALGDHENQLELFDLANQPAAKMRRESVGRMAVYLRYDQAILLGIAALLGITVIFAFGVERGKQLVRSDALRVARQSQAPPVAVVSSEAKTARPVASAEPVVKKSEAAPARKMLPSAPAMAPQTVKSKVRVASGASRYAVQVATYSRPQLAKVELQRLHSRGESAFIMIRQGHTIVYAGPFPSRDNASEKLVGMKSLYQDCFIKTL